MTSPRWLNRTVLGIILATFFSDVSHEMCTAVLPDFIKSVGMGAMAIGIIEGFADLLVSFSKLGGGILGHHVERKQPWTAVGYLITSVCTAAIGFTKTLGAMVSLRTIAWAGRGFRSPLRDFLLADAVEKTHYGRAYGVERAADMLGAMVGPLFAALMIWFHVEPATIIKFGIVPGLFAAGSMFFIVRERKDTHRAPDAAKATAVGGAATVPLLRRFPALYWSMLVGVLLFGIGDFSRTFLIFLAAQALDSGANSTAGSASIAAVVHFASLPMLLYAMHNAISALAAYPAGHLGDRRAKLPILVAGYGLGVLTNLLLAVGSGSVVWLIVAFVMSGVYIAVEETLEKAVVAEIIPRELRSLGLGILACSNAVGDMLSSLAVGFLLQSGKPGWAFGGAAAFGALGVAWMLRLLPKAPGKSG